MASNQLSGPSTDRVVFTRKSADRIARAVRVVEGIDPQAAPLKFGKAPDADGSSSRAKVFRVCTYTGAWAIDTSKTLTFRNVTSTPNTVTAINLFAELSVPTPSPSPCAIARDGTAWYLIAARCPS